MSHSSIDHSVTPELRAPLRSFADEMEAALREHDADRGERGWQDDSDEALFERVNEECIDLQKAIESGDRVRIVKESADIANMAMMLWQRLTKSGLYK